MKTSTLLSVVDPRLKTAGFSAREAAKQLILLEDHLAVPGKQCPDCIGKHALAAEAFSEEALALPGADQFPWLQPVPGAIRAAHTAAEYRGIRKDLTSHLRQAGLGEVSMSRLQGQPIPVASYFAVTLDPWLINPIDWVSSNPALQVGLQYVGSLPEVGKHVFGCTNNPDTVIAMVRGDPRVSWIELVHQDPQDAMAQIAPPNDYSGQLQGLRGPVAPDRPAPGSPHRVWDGAIVKYPNEPHYLTWADLKRAEMGPIGLL